MKPWMKYALGGAALVILLGSVFAYRQFAPLINTGTGLVAHQMCSCVFVSNRELDVCLDDRWPDTQSISAEVIELDGVSGVQANGYISTRIATFESGFGCTLQD